MRLLTHNSLRCAARGVERGFPLLIFIEEYEVRESPFNRDFIMQLLPSLQWECLLIAAGAIDPPVTGLPPVFEVALLEDESFLKAMHDLLLDLHVLTGRLVCPETGREFHISDGIADMT